MTKVVFTKKITLDRDHSTALGAIREAKRRLSQDEILKVVSLEEDEVGFIYVVGENVSDLVVAEGGKLRERTDEEWLYYFRSYIVDGQECENCKEVSVLGRKDEPVVRRVKFKYE